ncbi:hypothetical protein A3Q56_05535 [Intoshia linei]|uniref:VWFA domain-containing protein n=1 Tax=Intoshia linei TaxID=1819745 RepID=A0A177AXM8_9BILA|nr:hypothetical protein A3Q56_05535 [Intoshia linei]
MLYGKTLDEWEKVKDITINVLENFNIRRGGTRVSVITYSNRDEAVLTFCEDFTQIKNIVNDLPFIHYDFSNYIVKGLELLLDIVNKLIKIAYIDKIILIHIFEDQSNQDFIGEIASPPKLLGNLDKVLNKHYFFLNSQTPVEEYTEGISKSVCNSNYHDCLSTPLNLAFLIDISHNICKSKETSKKIKEFIKNIINKVDYYNIKKNIAIFTFAETTKIYLNFSTYNANRTITILDNLPCSKNETLIYRALKTLKNVLYTNMHVAKNEQQIEVLPVGITNDMEESKMIEMLHFESSKQKLIQLLYEMDANNLKNIAMLHSQYSSTNEIVNHIKEIKYRGHKSTFDALEIAINELHIPISHLVQNKHIFLIITDDLNECLINPCGRNGDCIDLIGGKMCKCKSNYGGEFCEKEYKNPIQDILISIDTSGSISEENFEKLKIFISNLIINLPEMTKIGLQSYFNYAQHHVDDEIEVLVLTLPLKLLNVKIVGFGFDISKMELMPNVIFYLFNENYVKIDKYDDLIFMQSLNNLNNLANVISNGCINENLDIVIVLDASGSIEYQNFIEIKDMLTQYTRQLPPSTRVGLVSFSDIPKQELELQSHDKLSIIYSIYKSKYIGGRSDIAIALEQAEYMLNQDLNYNNKILILATDGNANIRKEDTL